MQRLSVSITSVPFIFVLSVVFLIRLFEHHDLTKVPFFLMSSDSPLSTMSCLLFIVPYLSFNFIPLQLQCDCMFCQPIIGVILSYIFSSLKISLFLCRSILQEEQKRIDQQLSYQRRKEKAMSLWG